MTRVITIDTQDYELRLELELRDLSGLLPWQYDARATDQHCKPEWRDTAAPKVLTRHIEVKIAGSWFSVRLFVCVPLRPSVHSAAERQNAGSWSPFEDSL